ncbi:17584_t:CDS:2, partial [Dentiscutata erythropus]
PLNIGSDDAISIKELAYIAFETIGIAKEQIRLITEENKPVGVKNRNSDNTLISQVLGWSPKTSLRKGMEKTTTWIKNEIEKELNKCKNEPTRKELKESYRNSNVTKILDEGIKFGILLPITSRGLESPDDYLYHLRNFIQSVYETTQINIAGINGIKFSVKFFIGIDKDDHPIENNVVEQILKEYGFIDVEMREFDLPSGSICKIWNDLAINAYNQMCDYIVLFDNGIIIESTNWMSKIHEEFVKISNEKKVPYGFGMVTFTETTSPGLPKFPVISRLHIDIFNGIPFPQVFTNQDATSSFLFQLYRRFGCSVMSKRIKLMKIIESSKKQQYENDWSFSILDNAVLSVEKWMQNTIENPIPKLLTIDIVVPTYRVLLQFLEPIIRLKRSKTASTSIIMVVDDPNSPNIPDLKKYEHDEFVRIIVHEKNLGASEARNRGLKESCADYVFFIDDDLFVEPDMLIEAERIIRKFPKACGFVGCTKFPDPTNAIFTSAVKMSGLVSSFDVAERIEEDIPWGITANLIVRRYKDNIEFNTIFPKTGGGEDIDFCLQKRHFFKRNIQGSEGFRGAPLVRAVHPWWNNGKRSYRRFATWGYADGLLIKLYPEYSYKDGFPDDPERLLMLLSLLTIFLFTKIFISNQMLNELILVTIISIPLVVVANILVTVTRLVILEPESNVPELKGYRRVIAASETVIIRLAANLGKLYGLLSRKDWDYIGWRFDYQTGRFGDRFKNITRQSSKTTFSLWVLLVLLTFSYIRFNTHKLERILEYDENILRKVTLVIDSYEYWRNIAYDKDQVILLQLSEHFDADSYEQAVQTIRNTLLEMFLRAKPTIVVNNSYEDEHNLGFSNNEIDDEGTKKLEDALCINNLLTSLVLSDGRVKSVSYKNTLS